MSQIKPGIYVHYKSADKRYEVLGVAMNTETHEKYVVYRPLYESDDVINPDFWVRPYEMFVSNVEVDGGTVPRFKRVSE